MPAAVVISVVVVSRAVVVGLVVTVIMVVFVAVVLVLAVVMPVIVPVLFAHFIAVKLPFPAHVSSPVGSFTPMRVNPSISEPRVESMVHVTVEALRAMEPGARADEDSGHEPLRAVVAERRTAIWRIVE